jgi:hypothetical protein
MAKNDGPAGTGPRGVQASVTSSDAGAAAGAPGGRPPNIVTVILDCARAKNFPHSGGDRRLARTPNIDALARHGTAFPRAVAPANWTMPSHFSFFTGTYPNVHGVRTFQKGTTIPETTATHLRRTGYETAMFTEMVHLLGGYGMEEGFEVRRSRRMGISDEERTVANSLFGHANFLYSAPVRHLIERLPPLIAPLTTLNHPQEVAYKRDTCGGYTLGYFEEWLGKRARDRPFYAFFNFVNAHEPYDLLPDGRPLTYLERIYLNTPRYYLLAVPGLQSHLRWDALVAGYVQSIEEADRKIGRLVELLTAAGEAERTYVIVTSDHGQSFGESGNVFHGCGATDSILRVPLVVGAPPSVQLPPRVGRWTSLTEIDSWLKAISAGHAPFDQDGVAPFPYSVTAPDHAIVYSEGGPASDPNRSLRGIRTDQPWNRRLLAAYRGEEKFVLDLATGTIQRWSRMDEDPDRHVPEILDGDGAATVRRAVFGPYEDQEKRRVDHQSHVPPPVEVALDQRLRSWGYD